MDAVEQLARGHHGNEDLIVSADQSTSQVDGPAFVVDEDG